MFNPRDLAVFKLIWYREASNAQVLNKVKQNTRIPHDNNECEYYRNIPSKRRPPLIPIQGEAAVQHCMSTGLAHARETALIKRRIVSAVNGALRAFCVPQTPAIHFRPAR
jgi:hypothetical protein